MKINSEILEKIKNIKSMEELLTLARENDIEITEEQKPHPRKSKKVILQQT